MSKDKNKQNIMQVIYIVSLVFIGMLIATTFIYCLVSNNKPVIESYMIDITIDVMGMVLCGILVYSLSLDKPWDKENRAFFRLLFLLCVLFHFDLASSYMEGNPQAAAGVKVLNTVIPFVETWMAYCLWVYIREELKIDKKIIPVINNICKALVFVELVVEIINYKLGFFFTVDEAGMYINGRFAELSELSNFLIFIIVLFVIFKNKNHSNKERGMLLAFLVFPLIAHFMAYINDFYSIGYPAYLFSIMLIYINVFATRSKKIVEQKAELDRQRATLMISQIQPHFIYNVLTTISNLCVKDPEEAEETTVLFSQYLRTNLDSLRRTEPVKFSAELGHINTYILLEKKRFKEKLNVEIDCKETNFLVPALGLQPIVENSIKHGIRGKETPGHLKISSRKVDAGYEVVIEDDGVGFDPAAPQKEDGRSHVGMTNVKSRLEQICNATVTVESSPGNGCKTTIIFPEDN